MNNKFPPPLPLLKSHEANVSVDDHLLVYPTVNCSYPKHSARVLIPSIGIVVNEPWQVQVESLNCLIIFPYPKYFDSTNFSISNGKNLTYRYTGLFNVSSNWSIKVKFVHLPILLPSNPRRSSRTSYLAFRGGVPSLNTEGRCVHGADSKQPWEVTVVPMIPFEY